MAERSASATENGFAFQFGKLLNSNRDEDFLAFHRLRREVRLGST